MKHNPLLPPFEGRGSRFRDKDEFYAHRAKMEAMAKTNRKVTNAAVIMFVGAGVGFLLIGAAVFMTVLSLIERWL